MSFQLFVLIYIRFILAGDMAGAWANFGGIAAQWAHLGTLLTIAVTDNALAAMAHDRSIRTTIETHSRKRIPSDQLAKMVKMLTEEHDTAKKAILREISASSAAKRPIVRKTTLKVDPSRRNKGEGKNTNKGKGKNQNWKGAQGDQGGDRGKGRKRTWGSNNSWISNSWWNWSGWENRQTQQADQPAEVTAQVNKKKKATEPPLSDPWNLPTT